MRGGLPTLSALGAVALLLAASASGAGPSTADLRRQAADLAAQSRSAVLGLYSLDSQLDRARASLDALHARAAALRRERALTRTQLAIAERAFRISQRQLAEQLRALYEQDQIDPLAIVLGAGSLDEAITGLDGIDHLASQNQSVIVQTRAARVQLATLSDSLAARQAELARLEASAAATAAALERTRAQRVSYIARLGNERRLTAVQITTLDAQARAAEAKSQTVALQSEPPLQPADPAPAAAPAPSSSGGQTITVTATGYSIPGRTATGLPTGWGVVAVDPGLIPLGTKLTIPGYGEGVAADTGGAVRGPTIDLWFPTVAQALAWGRRTVTITLH